MLKGLTPKTSSQVKSWKVRISAALQTKPNELWNPAFNDITLASPKEEVYNLPVGALSVQHRGSDSGVHPIKSCCNLVVASHVELL